MRASLLMPLFILIVPVWCFAQDQNQDSPVAVLGSSWQHTHQATSKTTTAAARPVAMITKDNKYFERAARENQTRAATNPNEMTIDDRSAALDKIEQEAQAPKTDDIDGYQYAAKMRNDTDRKVDVIFWEYRFTEIANPSNVVRRQFLCSAGIRPGESRELTAFSLLGPSDAISAESLAKTTGKIFDEAVLINRVEYTDGAIIQRLEWKYKDHRKAIERATSTPWGKEVCRGF